MALVIYKDAVREFATSLAVIRQYATFVVVAHRLRPWLGGMAVWDGLGEPQMTALQNFISHNEYDMEVGFNGLVISLASAFENFMRRLIREGVLRINESVDTFENLTEPQHKLHQQHLYRSGKVLVAIYEPAVETPFDYEVLCKNLGTCRREGGEMILNADAFASEITNVTPDRIDKALLRIGIEINWDVFGRSAGLQKVFNETKVRETRHKTIDWLKDFIKRRNRIAHSGVGGIQTSEGQLNTALDFFTSFGPVLAEAMDEAVRHEHG